MKKILFIIGLLAASCNLYSQTIGTKKSVVVKFVTYECGDFCYIEFKDATTGTTYTMDNIDEKTKDNGILDKIEKAYYESEQALNKYKGKSFKAEIEYRIINEYKIVSPEEPPVKTGKKLKRWMINTLNY